MEVNEFNIPVPWGHIACKTYGNPNNPPILMIHGILDNLASFDALLPLLTTNYFYITIDLPGHGLSSPFGKYLIYFLIDNVMAIKYVIDYFKYEKLTIIAHSFGGQAATLLTLIYPKLIEKLVVIDAPFYTLTKAEHLYKQLKYTINFCMDTYQKQQINPNGGVNTYEEAINKIQNQRRFDRITRAAAERLAKRGLIAVGNDQYRFTGDKLVNITLTPLHDYPYVETILKTNSIKCPYLLIITEGFEKYGRKYTGWDETMAFHKKAKNVKIVHVQGNHDLHMYKPVVVAPYINDFLKQISKL